MQLSLPFIRRVVSSEEEPSAEKLQALIRAARKTSFYAGRLKSAAREPQNALAALPPVPLRMVLENREQFTNPAVRSAAASMDRVQMLSSGWFSRGAEAIAGPTGELERMAGAAEAGQPAATRGARRLVVYTKFGDRMLSAEIRERLWQAFELPVFEQLRGLDCEMLASECEAHDGLHLETGAALFEILDGELVVTSLAGFRYPVMRLRTGFSGSIDRGACACGASTPRFLAAAAAAPLRKPPSVEQQARRAARLAATAV